MKKNIFFIGIITGISLIILTAQINAAQVLNFRQGGTGTSTIQTNNVFFGSAGGQFFTQSGNLSFATTSNTLTTQNLTVNGTCTGCGGTFAWTSDINYGTNVNSTSTPIWFKQGLMASTTSYFVNASTSQLSVSTNSYLGTILSGTWNGAAIGDTYISSAATWNGKQAGDATLTALAGLTIASGDLIYGTGVDAFSTLFIGTGGGVLIRSSGLPAWSATSSLGLLTTNVTEGSNLYYTEPRWQASITATTTLPQLTTLVNLATVGTITTGTWSATKIGATNGGTNQNTWTKGDLLYSDNSDSLNKLGIGTGGFVLGSVSGVPGWVATTTLSTITGTLSVAKGGTGQTAFPQGWLNSNGSVLSASTSPTVNYLTATSTSATSTFPYLSVSTNSNVGTVVGGTWNGTSITVPFGGTGVGTFASNGVLYGNGTGNLSVTTQGGANSVLTANAGAPSFSASPVLTNITSTASSTVGGLLTIGGNATTTGIHTFNSRVKVEDGNSNLRIIKSERYVVFGYSTSTAWTGTTTLYLAPADLAETWNYIKCETNAGTLNVSVYDGTTRMDLLNASTTIGTFTFATNNTIFTASKSRRVDLGTPATSPTKISCKAAYYFTY